MSDLQNSWLQIQLMKATVHKWRWQVKSEFAAGSSAVNQLEDFPRSNGLNNQIPIP